jgi:hypothetical protein
VGVDRLEGVERDGPTGWGFPEAVRGWGWLMDSGDGGRPVGFREKKNRRRQRIALGRLLAGKWDAEGAGPWGARAGTRGGGRAEGEADAWGSGEKADQVFVSTSYFLGVEMVICYQVQ